MITEKALAKQQGADFGSTTRDLAGGNAYNPPSAVISLDGDLAGSIAHWVDILSGLATIIAIGALTWAGILWAMSAGDEEKIHKAKTVIKLSIFGLILTLIAWVIVGIVMDNFA